MLPGPLLETTPCLDWLKRARGLLKFPPPVIRNFEEDAGAAVLQVMVESEWEAM